MNTRSHSCTVAVLADVHGNAAALRAVLNALDGQPYDTMVFAGDLVLNGPRPAETLDIIRGLNVPAIYGNADRYVCDPTHPDPGVQWARERLEPDAIAWLARLPFAHRITPPDGESPADDLLIVHATPTDVGAALILQTDRFGLLTVTPQPQAERLLGSAQAGLILAGHLHYASSGNVGERRCATVGSVGFPCDGDARAAYAWVRWDGANWEVEHCRVNYDHLQVAAEIAQSGFPFAANSAERLRRARFIPPRVASCPQLPLRNDNEL